MTAEYNHNQPSPNTVWNINHALNSDSVAVDVMVNTGSPVQLTKTTSGDVRVIDANNIRVTFLGAESGRARIVGEF